MPLQTWMVGVSKVKKTRETVILASARNISKQRTFSNDFLKLMHCIQWNIYLYSAGNGNWLTHWHNLWGTSRRLNSIQLYNWMRAFGFKPSEQMPNLWFKLILKPKTRFLTSFTIKRESKMGVPLDSHTDDFNASTFRTYIRIIYNKLVI